MVDLGGSMSDFSLKPEFPLALPLFSEDLSQPHDNILALRFLGCWLKIFDEIQKKFLGRIIS